MPKLTRIKQKLLKTDDGEVINPNLAKFEKQLDELLPGHYELIIQRMDTSVIKKKKFYFQMETDLAKFTGYTKLEMHEVLKKHVGIIVVNGEPEYESMEKVTTDERMMERILELQEFAALTFNFKTQPYREENNG